VHVLRAILTAFISFGFPAFIAIKVKKIVTRKLWSDQRMEVTHAPIELQLP
jgi:hypothetical protein